MEHKDVILLDMLSLVYEEMDIDAIEERFVAIVSEIFSFDRVALFFVKHRKKVLKGKLCKGFAPGTISSIEIPVVANYSFTRPLVTGFPIWGADLEPDTFTRQLGLANYAVIPIVNQKRIACWRLKKCTATGCPAFGKQWLRCWLVPGTMCSDGNEFCGQNKMILCENCAVFKSHNTSAVEGILLIDNTLSQKVIDEKTITILSVIAHAVGIAINNSKAYSHALREAIHDDLTGLHNRRYFNERLLDEVDRARRYGNEISLLLGDIDFFKNINDTYGHPVGDEVLGMIGTMLRSKLRKTDIVARYGGEEFAIILLNTDKDKSVEIAENLRQAIAEAVLPGRENLRLTISFGVAAYGKDAQTFEGLINSADKALYHAKAQGRNRVGS